MQLRHKTLVVIIVMIIVTVLLMYAISQLIFVKSFQSMEDQNVQSAVSQAMSFIGFEQSELNRIAVQLAYSDNTYAYMDVRDMDYITSNVADSAYDNLRLNFLILLDTSGNQAFAKGYDLSSKMQVSLPDGLTEHLSNDSILLRSYKDSAIDGIIMTGNGPMLVSACPIKTTYGNGTSRGTLIVGRYLGYEEIGMLKSVSGIDLSVRPFQGSESSASDMDLISGVTRVTAIDSGLITGEILIRDAYGNPALVLQADLPRPVNEQAQNTLLYITLAVLMAGLLLGLMTLMLLDKLVISRVMNLIDSVSKIGREDDLSVRVPVSGDDELSMFAGAINRTLDALEISRHDLRASEHRFRGLVENVNDTIWELDDHLRFTYVSPKIKRLLGYGPEDVIGKTLIDLISEPDRERVQRQIHGAMEKRDWFALIEVIMVHKDGTPVDVEISGTSLKDGSGKIMGYNGIARDVRERKAIDIAMRLWADIFYFTRMAMVVSYLGNTKFELMNPAFASLYGYTREEMAGMKMEDVIAPDYRKVFPVQREKAVEDGHFAFQSQHIRKDDTKFPVHIDLTVVKGTDGKVLYQIANVQDITDVKMAQEKQRIIKHELELKVQELTSARDSTHQALQASETKYRELVQTIHSIVIRFDAKGNVRHFNRYACGLFGYAPEEITGKSLFDTIMPRGTQSGQDLDVLLKKLGTNLDKPIDVTSEALCRNGQKVWIAWRFGATRDQDDGIGEVLATGNDITGLKQAAEEIERANKGLEERVRQRTAELETIVKALRDDIAARGQNR